MQKEIHDTILRQLKIQNKTKIHISKEYKARKDTTYNDWLFTREANEHDGWMDG